MSALAHDKVDGSLSPRQDGSIALTPSKRNTAEEIDRDEIGPVTPSSVFQVLNGNVPTTPGKAFGPIICIFTDA